MDDVARMKTFTPWFWKGIFSGAVPAPARQNCAVCPLETIAYHCGETLWRFISEDPRLVMIPYSDSESAECLSGSEVALWMEMTEKGLDVQVSM